MRAHMQRGLTVTALSFAVALKVNEFRLAADAEIAPQRANGPLAIIFTRRTGDMLPDELAH